MARCEACGNEYDKSFQVIMADEVHTFDSFECAVHMLAPKCAHCGITIVGHGVEHDDVVYCCQSCAAQQGVEGLRDRS